MDWELPDCEHPASWHYTFGAHVGCKACGQLIK